MRFSLSSIAQGLALGLFVAQAAAAPKPPTNFGFDSVMARDPSVRAEILRNASPEDKSKFWTGRLENYRANREKPLTTEQSEVIDSAIAGLENWDRSLFPKIKEEFESAFGVEEARAITTTMDGKKPPRQDDLTAKGGKPLCNCSLADPWCYDGFFCSTTPSCYVYPEDCGLFWGYTCDGLCAKV
ncbi:hypothetical protein FQN54_007197 [Arachnomyces sp. PD_36]|nr:hypothetical protein FQN54_007197 [Arachnomyces sp. PD_36]